jgi:hypothetical protein
MATDFAVKRCLSLPLSRNCAQSCLQLDEETFFLFGHARMENLFLFREPDFITRILHTSFLKGISTAQGNQVISRCQKSFQKTRYRLPHTLQSLWPCSFINFPCWSIVCGIPLKTQTDPIGFSSTKLARLTHAPWR